MLLFLLLLIYQIGSIIGFYFITPNNYWLLFAWVPAGFLVGWILFIVTVFLVFYPFFLVTKPYNKAKHKVINSFSNFVLIITNCKVKYIGRENVPNETFVAFGNHKSMLDCFLVYSGCHTVMSAVAKKSLSKIKIVNLFFKVFGVVGLDRENDRQGVKDLLTAIKFVEGGYSFMIFPEGGIKTRENEEIEAVKPGAFKLATKPEVLVLPVSIIGSSKCAKRSPFRRTKITVRIHKPIGPSEYKDMTTQELGDKVIEIINQGVKAGY